jgi:hypothetical protein
MIKQPPVNELQSVQLPEKSNVVSIYTYNRILDPVDAEFDFAFWSQVVKRQMLAVIEKKVK